MSLKKQLQVLSLFIFFTTPVIVNAAHHPLSSAAEPDYPPFSFKDSNNKAAGFSIDLLNAAARAMERNVQFKVAPWSQIKQELADNKLDVLPLVARTPEREAMYDFTIPYLTLHGTIVVRKDNKTIYNENDLRGKTIAVLNGDVAEEFLVREQLDANIITTESFEIALQQLNRGKFDAVVVQKLVALQIINKLKLDNLETRSKLKKLKIDWCFAVTEGNKQLLAELNEGLSTIIADGSYDEIRRNWLGILEEKDTTSYFYIISIAVLTTLAIAFLIAQIWQKSLRVQIARSTSELEMYKNDLEKLVTLRTSELEAEKHKLNQAQEITHVGSYRWDVETNKTTWSDELFRITGHQPQEFEPTYEIYLGCIHPDDKAFFQSLTEHVMQEKSLYSGEYRVIRPDGETRYIAEKGEVTLDDAGNILALLGVIQDITERKTAEVERTRIQQELLQAQKMESLGQLTGGIAHDFNNLLGIINGYTELSQDISHNFGDEKLKSYLKSIADAGQRATTLVAQMLSFSRGDTTENKPLQFSRLVSDEIKMLRSTLPSTIQIKQIIAEDLPDVMMNPTQLHQIIMNLSINARDAMDGTGELTIQLGWARNLDTRSTVSHKPVRGDWIELSVSDTGQGIDEVTKNNIFNPFFTTKEVGKGTGMGLAVIYRIMENHSGHIILESEPGQGCHFRMLFSPLLDEDKKNIMQQQGKIEIPMGDGSCVLVVDDEPQLCDQVSEFIKLFNYEAISSYDSIKALEIFKQNPQRFSLIITDQTMPNMTGSELIEKIREITPGLPAIICSGYSDKIDAVAAAKQHITYLDKPVSINILLPKVAELLDIQ